MERIKVCPKCGSKLVVPIFFEESEVEPHFTCKDCRWIGEGIIFATEPYQWLLKLRVTIEIFEGPMVEVDLDFIKEQMVWQRRAFYFAEPEKVEKKLSPEEIKRIEIGMMRCNVLSWDRYYDNNHTLDGTSWKVEMEFGLEREGVQKSGSNDYPPQWKTFCKILEKIIGKKIL